MKKYIVSILCLAAVTVVAQPPQRQESDLDESHEQLFDKKKMGNVEVVRDGKAVNINDPIFKLEKSYTEGSGKTIDRFLIGNSNGFITDKSLSISMSSTPGKHHKLAKKQKKLATFNPKKDKIESYIIESHSDGGKEIKVINKLGKYCDMSDFRLEPISTNITKKMVAGYPNACAILGSSEDYASGRMPSQIKFRLVHVPSGLSTEITYTVKLYTYVSDRGADKAYVIEKLNNCGGKYCRVTDMGAAVSWVLPYPLKVDVSGKDGAPGRNGMNGFNGMNAYDWTDKNGKKHHVNGTCGRAGGHGGNGGDGQNGGHAVLYIDKQLYTSDFTVECSGGAGGRAGYGGAGGMHGLGSPCGYGSAPRGVDGVAGSPGSYGGQKKVLVDKKLIEEMNTNYKLILSLPYFYIQ